MPGVGVSATIVLANSVGGATGVGAEAQPAKRAIAQNEINAILWPKINRANVIHYTFIAVPIWRE